MTRIKRARAALSDAWYWTRTHTYNRYHIVDMRCPDYGLEYKWGWIDRCDALLIAPFQILVKFMEEEFPVHPHTDWDAPDGVVAPSTGTTGTPGTPDGVAAADVVTGTAGPGADAPIGWAFAGREFKALYTWWKHERKAEWDAAHEKFRKARDANGGGGGGGDGGKEWDFPIPANLHPALVELSKAIHALEEKDDTQLARLMKVRGYMWT